MIERKLRTSRKRQLISVNLYYEKYEGKPGLSSNMFVTTSVMHRDRLVIIIYIYGDIRSNKRTVMTDNTAWRQYQQKANTICDNVQQHGERTRYSN